jgi:RNA polymerase sigma factor (sigma-70 family)
MDVERLLENSAWVRSLAATLVSDPHDADDLVQETWVAALRRPPRERSAHRSWLRRVLRNFAYISFRNRSRRLERERMVASPEAIRGPEEAVERAELTRRLVERVLDLDEPSRTVIMLRYFDGLTGAEIAARLGVQPGAVRMRLKRALDQLRQGLGEDPGAREAWRGVLLFPLVAAGRPPASPAPGPAAAGPGLSVAGAGSSLIAKAALVVCCLGAGGLLGTRLAEPPPASSVSTAVAAAEGQHDARIRELEETLEEMRSELEQETAWRIDLESRLRSTQEAVAQLSSRLAVVEQPVADPA